MIFVKVLTLSEGNSGADDKVQSLDPKEEL